MMTSRSGVVVGFRCLRAAGLRSWRAATVTAPGTWTHLRRTLLVHRMAENERWKEDVHSENMVLRLARTSSPQSIFACSWIGRNAGQWVNKAGYRRLENDDDGQS